MSDNRINPNVATPPLPPVLHVPAEDSSIQATNTALAALLQLMGNPAQEGTIAGVLTQLAQFGAQPWVPNMQNAPVLEVGPGTTQLISPPPSQPFRVWGGYISVSARTNNTYTGTDGFYGKIIVRTNPPLVVCHVELAVAGPQQTDSKPMSHTVPGVPVPAGTRLELDLNGGVGLGTTGVLRASGNVHFSIP